MKPTALITGASSPLGLSLIEKLKDVYNLILIYNENLEPLKKYVDNHRVIHCDFTKEDEILNLIKEINEMGVNISLLINMAALTRDSLKEDINMPDFTDSYKVNVYAPLKLIISLPLNSSVILNISSTDGIDTFNEYGIVYSLTKSSMIHLTKILSSISEKNKIYALAPNYIDTEIVRKMNPEFLKSELNRIGQKELITLDRVTDVIIEIINSTDPSGTIYRMDDNDGYRKIN